MDNWLEVKKSKVMIDLDQFSKWEWYDDPGWGLFQKIDGMVPIKFVGPEIISVPRNARDYPHSYPILLPKRPLKKGDEITFNYNTKKSK